MKKDKWERAGWRGMENSETELNGRGRDGNQEIREKKEGNGKKRK